MDTTQNGEHEVVTVPVELPVLQGEEEISLDDAIDRLGVLQEQGRQIEAERKGLREVVEYSLRRANLRTHMTPGGHSATLYVQSRTSVDLTRLRELLTAEQYDEVVKTKGTDGMRIR